jgi:hypothetical protein
MNNLVAVGRVSDFELRKTQAGKEYGTFTLRIPVKGQEKGEVEIKKYCTIWLFPGDRRLDHLQDGAYVLINATIEGYTVNKEGRSYVNEKLKVIDVQLVNPSLEEMVEKNEEKNNGLPF